MTKELAADLPGFLSLPLLLPRLRRVGTTVAASSAAPPFFFVFPDQHRRRGFVCVSRRRRPPDHPLPPHHRHDRLLRPRLLFLPVPPSASLLSLCSTGDLPGSLFFLRCRSSSTGAAVAGSVVLPPESLRSPSPCFPPMPPATAHFFSLRFLLRDAVAVILIAVGLLCLGDAFPPPFSSSLSP